MGMFVPRLPQRTRHLMDEAELIPQESGPWRTEVLSLGCWSQKWTTVHRLCQADSGHLGTNCIRPTPLPLLGSESIMGSCTQIYHRGSAWIILHQ